MSADVGRCEQMSADVGRCRQMSADVGRCRQMSADVGRVARLLAGKAVGVCFGGGGARGNVHFGVIQAMQELGIPIDVVSGTSFGALAAAMPLSRKSTEISRQ